MPIRVPTDGLLRVVVTALRLLKQGGLSHKKHHLRTIGFRPYPVYVLGYER